jgi:anti-sigma factor RsiW
MSSHETWVRQIAAELDGELSLAESAALARHLATCSMCAGARISQLELRVALARSAGAPEARAVPRSPLRARAVTAWLGASLLVGAVTGWVAHARWGGPGHGSLEASRAAFAVQ